MLCVLMSVAVLVNCSGSVCWVCIPKNSSWSNVPYLLPHAHAQGVKQSVLSVCLFISQHKNCEIWRSRHHSKMQVSLQCREGGKTYLVRPSRHLKRATSVYVSLDHAFRPHPVMPCAHVLPQPRMLKFSVGKDRQVYKLRYACRSWMQLVLLLAIALVHAHRVLLCKCDGDQDPKLIIMTLCLSKSDS